VFDVFDSVYRDEDVGNYLDMIKTDLTASNIKSLQTKDPKKYFKQWKSYTAEDAQVDWSKVRKFYWITRLFGLTFGTKLMERGEAAAQREYADLFDEIDQAKTIAKEESDHESVAMDQPFKKRFVEMTILSLGVSGLSLRVVANHQVLRLWFRPT
jgi:hypothetical protein